MPEKACDAEWPTTNCPPGTAPACAIPPGTESGSKEPSLAPIENTPGADLTIWQYGQWHSRAPQGSQRHFIISAAA